MVIKRLKCHNYAERHCMPNRCMPPVLSAARQEASMCLVGTFYLQNEVKGALMIVRFQDHLRDPELSHVRRGTVPARHMHAPCLASQVTGGMHVSGRHCPSAYMG